MTWLDTWMSNFHLGLVVNRLTPIGDNWRFIVPPDETGKYLQTLGEVGLIPANAPNEKIASPIVTQNGSVIGVTAPSGFRLDGASLESVLYGEFPFLPPRLLHWQRLPEPLTVDLLPEKSPGRVWPLEEVGHALELTLVNTPFQCEKRVGDRGSPSVFRGQDVTVEISFPAAGQSDTQGAESPSVIAGAVICRLCDPEASMSMEGWDILKRGMQQFFAPFVFPDSPAKIRAPLFRSHLAFELRR